MSGSTANTLTNPAVSYSGEVPTLLIEKFTGRVHEEYMKGENLLSNFEVHEVTGTNMISNKYLGGTTVQRLVAGQEPEAVPTNMDKNALVVDTVLLARNTVATLHDVQSDIEIKGRLAENQSLQLKRIEDQMVIQQLIAGASTGGTYDGIKVTGGLRRLPDHGAAVKVEVNQGQLTDPYVLVSAIEFAIMGLIAQKVPVNGMKIILPIQEFSTLCDYGIISAHGVSQEVNGFTNVVGLSGTLKSYGIPVLGSVQFTQMLAEPAQGENGVHHLLSNADNGYRYDVTADIQKGRAIVFYKDALLCGRTIGLQGDIFFEKRLKTYYIDTWLAEGAIPDRYDNMAIVLNNGTGLTQAEVLTKAMGKAKLVKTDIAAPVTSAAKGK